MKGRSEEEVVTSEESKRLESQELYVDCRFETPEYLIPVIAVKKIISVEGCVEEEGRCTGLSDKLEWLFEV